MRLSILSQLVAVLLTAATSDAWSNPKPSFARRALLEQASAAVAGALISTSLVTPMPAFAVDTDTSMDKKALEELAEAEKDEAKERKQEAEEAAELEAERAKAAADEAKEKKTSKKWFK